MGTKRDVVREARHLAEQSLRRIDDALSSRRKLTVGFVAEINREIAEAKRALNLLGDPWKHGDESLQYETQRIALDKALTARKKDRRAEQLREWKDLLRLQERRMELLGELAALGPGKEYKPARE